MYRISNKLLKKGEIFDRGPYFFMFGYEYTFRLASEDPLKGYICRWIDQNMARRMKYYTKPEDPDVVIVGFDFKFELIRHRRDGDNVMYHAFFSKWKENSYDVCEGNEMNQLLTALELQLLRFDPLTWVRDMWVPRERVGKERTFDVWKTKYPEYRFTPEEIKSRGYNNGRPFEEKYLADRLRGYGAQVYGGSAVSPTGAAPSNPLVAVERKEAAEKLEKLKEAEAAKKEEAERPKVCPACGAEVPKGTRVCTACGTRFTLTLEEKKAEEVTEKEFPMFTIREPDDRGEPYIFPYLSDDLIPLPEAMDGNIRGYRLEGISLSKSPDGQKGFQEMLNLISRDNYLYLTESRLIVLNQKYNKNEAGSWIGFGGVSAMVIGEALTAAGRAVEAHKRKGKALVGHLRYEWISMVRYKEKKGILSYPVLEIYYKDINKTTWCLTLYLPTSDGGAYSFAEYLVHALAIHRTKMDDKKDEDTQKFIDKYTDVKNHIPLPPAEGDFAQISVPVYYFATKGKVFCPWYYE